MHSRLRSLCFLLTVSLPQSLLHLRSVSLAIPKLALAVPTEAHPLQSVPNRHGGLILKTDLHLPVPLGDGVSPIRGRYGLLFALLGGLTRIFSRILCVSLRARRLLLLGIHSGSLRPGVHQDGHSLIRNGTILPQDTALLGRGHRVGSRHPRLAHGAESGCYLLHGKSVRHVFGGSRLGNRLLCPVAFLCGVFGRGGFICPHLLGRGFCGDFRGFRGLLDWFRGSIGGSLGGDLLGRSHDLLGCDLGGHFRRGFRFSALDLLNSRAVLLQQLIQLCPRHLTLLIQSCLQLLRQTAVGIQSQSLCHQSPFHTIPVQLPRLLVDTRCLHVANNGGKSLQNPRRQHTQKPRVNDLLQIYPLKGLSIGKERGEKRFQYLL